MKFKERKRFIDIVQKWRWSQIHILRKLFEKEVDEIREFFAALDDQCWSVANEDDDYSDIELKERELSERLRLIGYAIRAKKEFFNHL